VKAGPGNRTGASVCGGGPAFFGRPGRTGRPDYPFQIGRVV